MAEMTEDLIKMLEAAPEGSRELDGEVFAQVCVMSDFDDLSLAEGWEPRFEPVGDGSVNYYAFNVETEETHRQKRGTAPHFTTSLDAALTLVPEDCDYLRFVSDPSGDGWEIGNFSQGLEHYKKRGEGVTGGLPALALCIAALKARGTET